MAYPGGKGNTFRHIVNQIPPHNTFISLFLGGGAIMRHKLPALFNIGLEINREVLLSTAETIAQPGGLVIYDGVGPAADMACSLPIAGFSGSGQERFNFYCCDAIQYLEDRQITPGSFVFCDPPYLMATRRSQRRLYVDEVVDQAEDEEAWHEKLLQLLMDLTCQVMICGYWSQLYCSRLSDWRVYTYDSVVRSGAVAKEFLWMNYEEPEALHDYRYLGDDFRERERITRKKNRWVNRLQRLDPLERKAILWALREAGLVVN